MRLSLTSVLVTAFMMHLGANTVAQQVTINSGKESIRHLFMSIHKQTGYHYLWSAKDINPDVKINVNIANKPLNEALSTILEPLNLSYEINNKTIVIKEKPKATIKKTVLPLTVEAAVQEKPITGRVVDAAGKPVSGATVRIKGTTLGTVSDADGKFSFKQKLASEHMLEITCVGYNQIVIDAKYDMGVITIREQLAEVEGVEVTINTGYQKISKERAAGSFSQVTEKDMEGRLQTNFLDRVEGLLPGMNLNLNESAANPQNKKNSVGIEVRGRSTLNAEAAPLIVVDGMPYEGDLTALNPNNLSSILK